jgi:phosphoribosyl-ATP pyrophosphohydrolase/phosphoribosyl-AMP cyclohydrolase/histidinol dehydrogenase
VAKSYTNRLFEDPKLLNSKILEEAHELVDASDRAHVVKEAADVIYFASVLCAREGIRFSEIERELDLRSLRIRRRKGDAKPPMKSD